MRDIPKKRFCIMIPGHWSRIMGGSQYQAKCLIEELNKTGRYQIYYITRDCDPDHHANGYNLVRYGYPGVHKRGTHRHLIEMGLLPRILKRIEPDIIYQRVGCAQTGIAARYAIKNRCKMIWHVASENDLSLFKISFSRLLVDRAVDSLLLRYGIKHAKQIIVQTKDQKRLLEKNYHRMQSEVIRNFHPASNDPIDKKAPIKIVWVSNLKDLKQPEIFVKLAHEFKGFTNIQFIMIGAFQLGESKKRSILNQFSKIPNLKYRGPESQETVNSILAQSHLLVNTSKWEGFPNTFIQAWMRQVPVISLCVDPDNIIENNGLGVVSGVFDKLKKDVADLVQNEELRSRMGFSAQKFALQHFSTKNVEQIIRVAQK